jgi:hypothetical protein
MRTAINSNGALELYAQTMDEEQRLSKAASKSPLSSGLVVEQMNMGSYIFYTITNANPKYLREFLQAQESLNDLLTKMLT